MARFFGHQRNIQFCNIFHSSSLSLTLTYFFHLSFRDCFYLCLLNSATSVVSGFAIFSVLGYMTHEQGVDISEVAESGKYWW